MTDPVILTEAERERFSRWVMENVGAGVVPSDEGDDRGLVYNLVKLIREGWPAIEGEGGSWWR